MATDVTFSTTELLTPSMITRAEAVQAMVERLIGRLDGAGIPYCLLRNRDRIPFGMLTWSDLDILVPADASTSRLIDLFADLSPSQIVDVRPGLVTFSFPVRDLFVRVDICYGDLDWRGAPFVTAEEVLANRWDDNGIMVASLLHQTYVTWISKLVWSGFYSDRYTPLIQTAMREHPTELHALLDRAFGRHLADQLIELVWSERLQESEALVPELRRNLWRRSLRRRPRSQLRSSIGQTINRVQTLLQPSGLVVAMVGPDADRIHEIGALLSQPAARHMPCGRIDRLVEDRRVLPKISNMKNTGFMSIFMYTYDTLNQSLSHWRWTRYRLTRGRLVLDERNRSHLSGPDRPWSTRSSLVYRWINRLAPRPDLTVVLETASGQVDARDHIVSADDVRSRYQAYRERADHRQDVRLVNADQPTDRVVADIRDHIINAYEDRTLRRYPRLSR